MTTHENQRPAEPDTGNTTDEEPGRARRSTSTPGEHVEPAAPMSPTPQRGPVGDEPEEDGD